MSGWWRGEGAVPKLGHGWCKQRNAGAISSTSRPAVSGVPLSSPSWISGSKFVWCHGHPLLNHVRLAFHFQLAVPLRIHLLKIPGWLNPSGIDLQTNGFIPSAQRWPATTTGLGSMPKSKNTALIFSTITSTGSSRKPGNHSQSRFSVHRATPLIVSKTNY